MNTKENKQSKSCKNNPEKLPTGILSTRMATLWFVIYLMMNLKTRWQKHSENLKTCFFFSSFYLVVDQIEIKFALITLKFHIRFGILRALIWVFELKIPHRYLYWIHKMANLGNKINITPKNYPKPEKIPKLFWHEKVLCVDAAIDTVECSLEFSREKILPLVRLFI